MAVPYSRKSRARSRSQRAANMKYTAVNVQACPSCGKYRDRQVLEKKEI